MAKRQPQEARTTIATKRTKSIAPGDRLKCDKAAHILHRDRMMAACMLAHLSGLPVELYGYLCFGTLALAAVVTGGKRARCRGGDVVRAPAVCV